MNKCLQKVNKVDSLDKRWLKSSIGFCSGFMIFLFEKCELCLSWICECVRIVGRKFFEVFGEHLPN